VGILCVYLTSAQLGRRLRLIGLICGLIPIANLIALFFILKTTTKECLFEIGKEQRNRQRRDQRICATKYPILMVHGVFFRDFKYVNYWGRIPKELETNGAAIFYGNQPSAASVADSAAVLKERILQILAETGAEKVNIIAHSKGGLDSRYAIAKLGMGEYVASLTTINTPHRGCLFADYLLTKIPATTQDTVASTYNKTLGKLGEPEADFLAAVNDLTDSACKERDPQMPTPEGIFCQSIGSVLAKAGGGKFPLNFSYPLVNHFSGDNDGLVSEDSFAWGEKYTLLRSIGDRGISHGDMIDLNRENIPGFDVREFYVELVKDLKDRGF
jgi:triacylglycerol lipase